jgi:hypothetical protein
MDKVKKLPEDIKTIWRLNALIDCMISLIIALAIFIGKMFAPKGMQTFLLMAGIIFLD